MRLWPLNDLNETFLQTEKIPCHPVFCDQLIFINFCLIPFNTVGVGYNLGSLLSTAAVFLLGLLGISELEELYGLLADLAVKTGEDAAKVDNLKEMMR